ncbi:hypothetical protein F5Y14DRAFT_402602 [Nemania sp. NC0429]|nr:hypothetical protein F5Y14DRAFT_402602 [Nemania sp. NC0429]
MSINTTSHTAEISRIEKVKEKVRSQQKIQPHEIGLKVRYQPPEVEDIEVDIVAIHGIGAHPEYTWTWTTRNANNEIENQVNWLQDSTMLPASFQNARIMTYGYESYWFGENAIRQTLSNVAESFLMAYRLERSECPHRPIIFVGHCFGGLVALQSYTTARIHNTEYPGISDSVAGIVFLGTPFRGIDHDSGMATVGELYVAIAKSEVQIEDNVLHTIAQDNDVLANAVNEFTRFLGASSDSAKPKLFCFWEQKRSRVGKVAKIEDMKPKYLVTESSGTLPGYGKQGLPLDHFSMNKFVGKDDNNYIVVRTQMLEILKNAIALSKGRDPRKTRTTLLIPQTSTRSMQSPTVPISVEKNFAKRNGIINAIEERFLKGPYVALYGESGNGKTHIAVEYASIFFRKSRKHVHWVNAGSAAEFELSYKLIAKTLGINRESIGDGDILEAVSDALSEDSSGSWLMIIDGCDDKTKLQVASLSSSKRSLLDYIPKKGFTRVLITTRSKSQAVRMVGGDREFALEVPTLEDADASFLLLGKDTTDANKRQKAASRAKQLGGSAGTLILAHLYQHKTSVLPKVYMEMIDDAPKRDESKTMRAWRLLYELMKDEHEKAAHLLLVMGSMEVQCIPNSFFDRDELWEKSRQLEGYGMVEPSANMMFITVTPLIQQCVQQYLNEDGEREVVEERVLSIMREKFHGNEHRTMEELLPCALAVLKFQRTSAEIKLGLAHLQSEVAKFYAQTKRHQLAAEHWEQAISLHEEDTGDNDSFLKEARKALDEAREQIKATDNSEKIVAKEAITDRVIKRKGNLLESEKVKGADHPDTIRTADELAMTQLMHGQTRDAQDSIELYKRVLKWCKTKQGDQSIDFARQQCNLALALERQAEYAKAEELYHSSSKIMALQLGPEHPEVLRVFSSLACLYCKQGRWEEAESVFTNTLLGQSKALGADHPDTLITRQNRAIMLSDTGKADVAVDELERVLAVQLQLLGHDNPAPYRTACSLAISYGLQGSPKKAEGLLRTALGFQKQLLGDAHPDTARTQLTLKELLDQMERH